MTFLIDSTPDQTPDAELVRQYQQSGNLSVLGKLYSRYMELVYGVCLKYLKQPEAAQDSVMTIFEELVSKLRRHDVANFRSWLYTLAKNHCLMRLRSQKTGTLVKIDEGLVQSADEGHLQDVLEKEADFERLGVCLEQLSPDQRRSIDLFYLQGKCYNEIAAATGLEWSQVRSHIQNGRRNLKICLEAQRKKSTIQ